MNLLNKKKCDFFRKIKLVFWPKLIQARTKMSDPVRKVYRQTGYLLFSSIFYLFLFEGAEKSWFDRWLILYDTYLFDLFSLALNKFASEFDLHKFSTSIAFNCDSLIFYHPFSFSAFIWNKTHRDFALGLVLKVQGLIWNVLGWVLNILGWILHAQGLVLNILGWVLANQSDFLNHNPGQIFTV